MNSFGTRKGTVLQVLIVTEEQYINGLLQRNQAKMPYKQYPLTKFLPCNSSSFGTVSKAVSTL